MGELGIGMAMQPKKGLAPQIGHSERKLVGLSSSELSNTEFAEQVSIREIVGSTLSATGEVRQLAESGISDIQGVAVKLRMLVTQRDDRSRQSR